MLLLIFSLMSGFQAFVFNGLTQINNGLYFYNPIYTNGLSFPVLTTMNGKIDINSNSIANVSMPVINSCLSLSIQSTSATSVILTGFTGNSCGNVLISGSNINNVGLNNWSPQLFGQTLTLQLSSTVNTTIVYKGNILTSGTISITACKGDAFISPGGGILSSLVNGETGNPFFSNPTITITITCADQSACTGACLTAKNTLIGWGNTVNVA